MRSRKAVITAVLFCALSVGAVFLFGQGDLNKVPKAAPESNWDSSSAAAVSSTGSGTYSAAPTAGKYCVDTSPSYYGLTIEKRYDTYADCLADVKKYTVKKGGSEIVQMPYQETTPQDHKTFKGVLVLDKIRRIGQTEQFAVTFTGIMYPQ
ncbi:MAG TPA: hypothetical protein VHP31_08565 [Caproicibacter sp.]|nr:hypothetical protein [Caproicibacter sp.]